MKKYIKNTILIVFSISILVGCQKELDTFNENPNNPSTTTPSLMLAAMEVGTFQIHTSGIMRDAGIFIQYLQGTDIAQIGAIGLYVVSESDVNNEWNVIYQKNLMNGHIISSQFEKDYPWYNGIGQILTAINLGYATDMWGDVPYDDAFKGAEGNKTPKYNTQQEIYARLQSILDQAIINLSKPETDNLKIPKDADFIFHGDTGKWIKVANVLKARYALRLTKVEDAAVHAQEALDYLTRAKMTSNADDANTYFYGATNSYNQWYAMSFQRSNYTKMGKYFVDCLKNNNDPRLPFMVGKDKAGGYSGNAPEDAGTTTSSYIGPRFASGDDKSQIGIVTYAEAKFIEAEANEILLHPTQAEAALRDAVTASVTSVTGTAPTADFLATATATHDVGNIIQQKYIALFLTLEPYNDYRRTGYPKLIPNQKSATKAIPVRLPTPSTERLYNAKATVISNVTTPVWWDKD